jgi:acetoacetate decarboxylase
MSYPPAPWTLQGRALLSPQWIDCAQVRPLLPPELRIVSPWPGKTLGGLYLATYGSGSTLEYNELIVVAGLVRRGRRFGIWVSHIYVDSPASMAGGREIWGLPKELAQFAWEPDSVTVRQSDRLLCRLRYSPPRNLWRQKFSLPAFSLLHSQLLFFQGRIVSRLGLVRARWEVPAESPFAALGLDGARLTISQEPMHAIIPAGQTLTS